MVETIAFRSEYHKSKVKKGKYSTQPKMNGDAFCYADKVCDRFKKKKNMLNLSL